MAIVVEGPAFVGKSMLIDMLTSKLNSKFYDLRAMKACDYFKSIDLIGTNDDVLKNFVLTQSIYSQKKLTSDEKKLIMSFATMSGFFFVTIYSEPDYYKKLLNRNYDETQHTFTRSECIKANFEFKMRHAKYADYKITLNEHKPFPDYRKVLEAYKKRMETVTALVS